MAAPKKPPPRAVSEVSLRFGHASGSALETRHAFALSIASGRGTPACAAYGLSGCACGTPFPPFPVLTGPMRTVLGHTFQGESIQPSGGSIDTNPDQTSNFVRHEPSIGVNYEALLDLTRFANFPISRHNPDAGNPDQAPPVIFATLKPAQPIGSGCPSAA